MLHDTVILFYLRLVQSRLHEKQGNLFEILPPSLTQLIKLAPDEDATDHLAPIKQQLLAKQLIFIPINDSMETEARPGTVLGKHWSLLIFSPDENIFRHFDTKEEMNKVHAKTVAQKISCAMIERSRPVKILKDLLMPVRNNDCGVWVLQYAQLVLDYFADNTEPRLRRFIPILNATKSSREMRLSILEVIDNVEKEEQQIIVHRQNRNMATCLNLENEKQ